MRGVSLCFGMKLSAPWAGLPGNAASFYIVPLTPPARWGLRGTCWSELLVKNPAHRAGL